MATKVLDGWALIAFFEDEPAAEQVEKVLAQAAADKHELLLSVVNWGEIYYNTMREVSQEAAERHNGIGDVSAVLIKHKIIDRPQCFACFIAS